MSADYTMAVWRALGVRGAVAEHRFDAVRKWRFDFAWPKHKLAVEVQGGTWSGGRHTRGAALRKEWEKLNAAATAGWRILYTDPQGVATERFAETIQKALTADERR
jgi:very-short-patch-repair endonuclease